MGALAQGMLKINDLAKLVVQFVKPQIDKTSEDCGLERMLEREARNDWNVLIEGIDDIQTLLAC